MAQISNEDPADDLHVIERVNLAFCIEMCILPKLPEYPRTKISGELPRLHLNLSDTKYKTSMKLIDLVLDSLFEKPNGDVQPSPVPDVEPLNWKVLTGASNVVDELAGGDESDVEKEETGGIGDEDDNFYDASENLGAAGVKAGNVVSMTTVYEDPKKVSVELRFEIHQASVSLKKEERGGAGESSLADLTVSGFGLDVKTRPFDLEVGIQIRSIQLEDRLQQKTDWQQFLLTPTVDESSKDALDDGQLVHIKYHSLKHNHPDYDGVDQSVDVSLAAVTIVLTQGTVLSLYDFILTTFTNAGNASHSRTSSQALIGKGEIVAGDGTQTVEGEELPPGYTLPPYPSTIRVQASMKSIGLIVNQDGKRLATATFATLQASVLMKESTMKVMGSIGNLSVVDEVQRVEGGRLYRQLLRIDGDEVAHFTWKTFNAHDIDYPGYDSALTLKASSMRLTYLESLINELFTYLSEFQKMHLLLEAARRAAMESAAQIQETAGRFHFDILIDTPILEFPHVSLRERDMVIVYPGSISAKNVFEAEVNGILKNKIVADISNMKAVSALLYGEEVRESRIIEDVNVGVEFESWEGAVAESVPDSAVSLLRTVFVNGTAKI